jgi:hypothetical protein
MIRNVTYEPPFMVTTSGGSPSYGSPGTVRWNPNTGGLEADLYGMWQSVEQSAHLMLDASTKEVLQWARSKMKQEQDFLKIIELHPEIKEMKDKLDLAVALVRDYD